MIFTQEQIDEIKRRLSLSGIKDSELDKLDLLKHPLTGKEVIAIEKDGENLRISVEDLYEEFAKYIEQSENKEDFFNVSVYLGRLDPEFENAAKPCTLEEAINACPPYIRRAGQTISFLDSHNMKWETYQYIGTKDDDWEDITLFENHHQALQDQIDAIVSDKAIVSVSASVTTFIVGEGMFTLTANTDTSAESIVIKQGSNVIATGSGKTLAQEVNVEQATAGNIVYTAEFTFAGGNKKTANATVYFVNKLYVGSGAAYTDVVGDSYAQSARRSPAGTYNVTVEQNGQYVFFVIPATMSINKATLSRVDFPLESPVNVTIEDIAYKNYRSSNTNDAGTYQIVIS